MIEHKPTFCCFIDFSKAFDNVDHTCLFLKLFKCGIKGKLFNFLYDLYSKCFSYIFMNNEKSDSIPIKRGVRQGDPISPTLFSIFINDLIYELKKLNCGISIGILIICALLYADDLVLISDSLEHLQKLLDCVKTFCSNWYMFVNISKTKIVSFIPKPFKLNDEKISILYNEKKVEVVHSYKYLGVYINKVVDWKEEQHQLLLNGKRACGTIFSNINTIYLNFKSGLSLWNYIIKPSFMYACDIWAENIIHDFDKLQVKIGKQLLHVRKSACNDAVLLELGWIPMQAYFDIIKLKFYFKLYELYDSRLTKQILLYSLNLFDSKQFIFINTWSCSIYDILMKYDLDQYWNVNISKLYTFKEWKNCICNRIYEYENSKLLCNISNNMKLNFYSSFKLHSGIEKYLLYDLGEYYKGVFELCKLRICAHSLEIEAGRWNNTSRNNRICKLCSLGVVEDELHYICVCPFYNSIRKEFYKKLNKYIPSIDFNDSNKWNSSEICFCIIGLHLFDLLYHDFNILKLIFEFLLKLKECRESKLNDI
jgi:hypothetical protein